MATPNVTVPNFTQYNFVIGDTVEVVTKQNGVNQALADFGASLNTTIDAFNADVAYVESVAVNNDPATIVHAPGSGLANEAGNAYSRDVGTGSGQLMEVGAFGLGSTTSPTVGDANSTSLVNGFYTYDESGGSTGGPPGETSGALLVYSRFSLPVQLFIIGVKLYWRGAAGGGGGYGSWVEASKVNDLDAHKSSGDHDGRYAQRSNNLSDLSSASSARNNLGLGSVATLNVIPANSVAGVNYDNQAAIWGSAWIGGEAMDGTNIDSSTRPSGPYSDVDVVGTLPTGNFIGVVWHQRRGARPVQYAVSYSTGKFYSRGYSASGWGNWLEYVDTTRNVHTGSGLQGGGNLGTDRTLSVDSSVVRTTRRVDAGAGLTGGGNFGSDKTISMGTPGSITEATTNSTSGSSHTHALPSWAVLRLVAQGNLNQVGTYALLRRIDSGGGTLDPGDTFAGSNFVYTNLAGHSSSQNPAGTWRMMAGPLRPVNFDNLPENCGLALRIS